MILNHRASQKDTPTEYTMALDRIEFIAIQCAITSALELIKASGDTLTQSGVDIGIIYAALEIEMRHPTEK